MPERHRDDEKLTSLTLPRSSWLVMWYYLQHGDVGAGFGRLTRAELAELKRIRATLLSLIKREMTA